MGRFKDRFTDGDFDAAAKKSFVPDWPKVCEVRECNEDTFVVHVVVRDQLGNRISGNGGRFTHRSSSGKVTMNSGYEFIRWIPRCCWHQTQDTARAENREEMPAAYTPKTIEEKRQYLSMLKGMFKGYTKR